MKTTRTLLTALLFAPLAAMSAFAGEAPSAAPVVPKDIKAYCLDFNWGPGGPNAFAKPGLWADADPAQHVAWYRAMGVNVIQTFCVSCNGYAWYKNGVVPEQPGLKHDFLPEVVKRALDDGRGIVIIDTRPREAFEQESLPGAINIPLAKLEARLAEFPKDTQLVFT